MAALGPFVDAAWTRISRAAVVGRTFTLKVKFADFSMIRWAQTRATSVADRAAVAETAAAILARLLPALLGVRLLGLALSGFRHHDADGAGQLALGL